ncbi:MAG: hypothetical protein ACU0AZ_09050 [Paracoccaceae bacterium]
MDLDLLQALFLLIGVTLCAGAAWVVTGWVAVVGTRRKAIVFAVLVVTSIFAAFWWYQNVVMRTCSSNPVELEGDAQAPVNVRYGC